MELRSLNMVMVCCIMYVNVVVSPLPAAVAVILLPNQTDHLSLMAFKATISDDPLQVLSTWNDSLHFCYWEGISCSNRHKQRVVGLSLQSKKLGGLLPPHIGNLSLLKILDLSNNSFTGEIPPEVSRLSALQILILKNNRFKGEIPINLSACSNIQILRLSRNNLHGRIPVQLGSLRKMNVLVLRENSLIGEIPNSLGNLSSLEAFDLEENSLTGRIPRDLALLQRLSYFGVSDNHLSDMVPRQLFNISSIGSFQISRNKQLQGSLPWDIGTTLPNLVWFAVGGNRFTGTIPPSLVNCSKLTFLEFTDNMFTGQVPPDLGKLRYLAHLYASGNLIGTSEGSHQNDLHFLSSLTNCTNLQGLEMQQNVLTGSLPVSMAYLSSQLARLNLRENHIYGGLPSGIGNLSRLNYLDLSHNKISDHIPDTFGKLQDLQQLFLYENRLAGRIPSSLGNLTQLSLLSLFHNKLNGSIPSSLGNCQGLIALDLGENNLIGPIPVQIFSIRSLSRALNLDNNYLTGSLPLEVGKLNNLVQLVVLDNNLSGSIPSTLGECVSLSTLLMQGNMFEEKIPESLSSLKGLENLDLSRNNLTGRIPQFLGDLPFLSTLILSFNDLEGVVPQNGIFRNASAFRVDGNRKLCGGISELKLPLCPISAIVSKQKSLPLNIIAPVVVAAGFLAILAYCVILHFGKRVLIENVSSTSSFNSRHLRISYLQLVKATNGFSKANLLGVGTYSSVYKGLLNKDEMIVAVKVLNLQQGGGSKSFISECKALRNVRHRNLVKILTSCSSIDSQGNDFKALVFEYIPNGNLTKWLYPEADQQNELGCFGFVGRLNIAIDVASALDYLHHHTHSAIVHCDLKPSNILLDTTMTAHVGDFGLAKLLSPVSDNSGENLTTSLGVRGTIGYVAPEYGLGSEVSTQGDVYSYGILLLEMFTGKRPTDDFFREGYTIHSFVNRSLSDRLMEVIDPRLLIKEGNWDRMQECLGAVLKVGIKCSMESPKDRMQIDDVVVELCRIREVYEGIRVLIENTAQNRVV